MQVIVIGAGLAGLTTAYYLRQLGAEVEVIDRATGVGRETSFANGGLISPSMADPWNAPGVSKYLLQGLFLPQAAMRLRLRAIPSLIGWGSKFLFNALPKRFEQNLLHNTQLSLYSQYEYRKLVVAEQLDLVHSQLGILQIFRNSKSLKTGVAQAHFLKQVDVQHEQLDVDDLVALEPALAAVADDLAGAIHFPQDESGNAQQFCEALAERCVEQGVKFHFSEGLLQPVMQGRGKKRRIKAVVTPSGERSADAYLLAAGSYTSQLGAMFGVKLPVRPVKGYSLSLDLDAFGVANQVAPQRPVVDVGLHAALVPMTQSKVLRVAGTAEFTGYRTAIDASRVKGLKNLVQRIYPEYPVDDVELNPWAGLRPMTPDGMPLLGATAVDNLFVNSGHGHLGWTMACGSGSIVAAQIMQALGNWQMPGPIRTMDLSPFASTRF